MKHTKTIIIAITGASGSIYPQLFLTQLSLLKNINAHVVMSENAKIVWQQELQNQNYSSLPFKQYSIKDFYAPLASGSSLYESMIIIPCSMGTLGRIAHGISNDLITRAADVMLKERRKLICVVRETPYNLIHIKNMELVTLAGGIICPATPSFYHRPQSIEELANTVVHRLYDLLQLPIDTFRWGNKKLPSKNL
ncbi:MAG: UbiX family flavin prenyltransferase [Chitinophagaceae bacterium]